MRKLFAFAVLILGYHLPSFSQGYPLRVDSALHLHLPPLNNSFKGNNSFYERQKNNKTGFNQYDVISKIPQAEYTMPIIKPLGNFTMPVKKPDSTITYTMLIKKY